MSQLLTVEPRKATSEPANVSLQDYLRSAQAEDLAAEITNVWQSGADLRICLANVDYVGCPHLQILLSAKHSFSETEQRLTLENVGEQLRSQLKLIGAHSLVE